MRAGIAGGGISGQLLALSLLNAGWDVTLFDASRADNCSMAAAGLLTPIAELEKNDWIICKLGLEAIDDHWPGILNQVASQIYFERRGSIVVSHPRDLPDLSRFMQSVAKKTCLYKELNQQLITSIEPELHKFSHGYFFPREAQLDNQQLMICLKDYLLKNNITWFTNALVNEMGSGLITVNEKRYHFDMVFDCRGMGAQVNFNDLRSVRGELIWLHAPDINISRPVRLIHPRYSLYLVPRPHAIYLIGASEVESNDASAISVRTALELLTAVCCIQSKFCEARIVRTVTQCRPTLPDHLPKIKYRDGLIAVNGLYRHGFLIIPSLVKDIMRRLSQNDSVHYPTLWEKFA